VIVSGNVHSVYERDEARRAACAAPGVTSVWIDRIGDAVAVSVSEQTGISDPSAAIGQAVSVLITCTSEHDPHGFKKGDGRRTSRA
jgi:hypothetical protein